MKKAGKVECTMRTIVYLKEGICVDTTMKIRGQINHIEKMKNRYLDINKQKLLMAIRELNILEDLEYVYKF